MIVVWYFAILELRHHVVPQLGSCPNSIWSWAVDFAPVWSWGKIEDGTQHLNLGSMLKENAPQFKPKILVLKKRGLSLCLIKKSRMLPKIITKWWKNAIIHTVFDQSVIRFFHWWIYTRVYIIFYTWVCKSNWKDEKC